MTLTEMVNQAKQIIAAVDANQLRDVLKGATKDAIPVCPACGAKHSGYTANPEGELTSVRWECRSVHNWIEFYQYPDCSSSVKLTQRSAVLSLAQSVVILGRVAENVCETIPELLAEAHDGANCDHCDAYDPAACTGLPKSCATVIAEWHIARAVAEMEKKGARL